MRRELFALAIVLLLLLGFPASLIAYQGWRTSELGVRVITLIGSAPGSGGWQPDTITVNLGERVRLRIASSDVVHGFAVPALGINVDEILPGHVQEVEFVPNQIGRFPFSCTRWCSVDHWRMRGVIQVDDPANPKGVAPTAAPPPLYQQLHLDLDAPHPALNIPSRAPSAAAGAALALAAPGYLNDRDYLRTRSPSDLFSQMRAETVFRSVSDSQLWDLIAFSFERAYGAHDLARGSALFARDCAACHGETGRGDGPAGANLPGLSAMNPEKKRGPADFTDASQMLGASDILLQGKVLRGGMGTGMPEWGSLYSQTDMRDVVGFLRSFIFRYDFSRKESEYGQSTEP